MVMLWMRKRNCLEFGSFSLGWIMHDKDWKRTIDGLKSGIIM